MLAATLSLFSAIGTWELVSTKHSPSARTSSAMCALEGGGLLLFGGTDGEQGSHFKDDTWLLSNGDWTQIEVAGASPPPRANAGCVAFKGGAVLFGGFAFVSTNNSLTVLDDTWLFESASNSWRQLQTDMHPPARAYFTFVPYLNGGGILFGGRTAIWTNPLTALGDTWIFNADGYWQEVASAKRATNVLQSLSQPAPSPRWGHSLACGLNATVPSVHALNADGMRTEVFVGPADCMLYGGAVTADEDYYADTWLLYRNGGAPVWKQQINWPAPRGRWCHASAACADGSKIVMLGGSVDYRVSDVGTWMWSPVPIPHEESTENPGHPPGHTGKWDYVDLSTGSGPNRTAGHMMATDTDLGVVVFGGAIKSTGGNHPGEFSNATWHWRGC